MLPCFFCLPQALNRYSRFQRKLTCRTQFIMLMKKVSPLWKSRKWEKPVTRQ